MAKVKGWLRREVSIFPQQISFPAAPGCSRVPWEAEAGKEPQAHSLAHSDSEKNPLAQHLATLQLPGSFVCLWGMKPIIIYKHS